MLFSYSMAAIMLSGGIGTALAVPTTIQYAVDVNHNNAFRHAYELDARALKFLSKSEYRKAVEKGQQMWQLVNNPREQHTSYTHAHLGATGWATDSDKRQSTIDDHIDGLEEAFKQAGLQFTSQTSLDVRVEHKKDSVRADGKTVPATFAAYNAVYNIVQGAIVVYSEHSPGYMLASTGKKPTAENVPAISHPSDILYLTWQKMVLAHPGALQTIRNFFVRGITSQSQPTRDILVRAMTGNEKGTPPQGWKKAVMFRRPGQNGNSKNADEPFYAVLGTMNFRTVAFMLAQHQNVFRGKSIGSVHVSAEGDNLHGMVQIV